jgi:hypothetical protein
MNSFWTNEEDRILADISKGYDEILPLLPGRSKTAIYSRANKLGYKRDRELIRKINSENQRQCIWEDLQNDEEFCEIIDGELLADGCIYRKRVKNRSCYEYSFIAGSVHREYAKYLYARLQPKLHSRASIKTIGIPKRKKSGFLPSRPFYSIRFSSVVFKSWYDRWYPNGSIKASVPNDLVLTPVVCLHWFLGDGSISHRTITLHTDNFEKQYVERLVRGLNSIKIDAKPAREKNKYDVIRLTTSGSSKFLAYIGASPIKEMSYKWGH